MAYRDQDLNVRCPYCMARPKSWCRKRSLKRGALVTISTPHKARVRKADADDNQGRAGDPATAV